MDVADRIVVMNHGSVEQVAGPRELYEHPANEFVMSFVGPVNRFGERWVRPHDLDLSAEDGAGSRRVSVRRVVHLGFEVRVELVTDDGEELWAQVARGEEEALGLEPGAVVYVRASRERVFDPVPPTGVPAGV